MWFYGWFRPRKASPYPPAGSAIAVLGSCGSWIYRVLGQRFKVLRSAGFSLFRATFRAYIVLASGGLVAGRRRLKVIYFVRIVMYV